MLEHVPSLRHLQVLESVARLESITRASAEIHLTQPAVTQAIAKLEASTGARLFQRTINGTHLTPAGARYLSHTERMLRGIEEALRQISPVADIGALARRLGKITRVQMRALIAISQSQSLVQAATLLGISQASLHRAARDLERNVGASLYHRAVTGVMTTDAGQLLACRFQLAINELGEVCEEIRAGERAASRCIRFGALMLDPAALLGSVMVEFTRSHPETFLRAINSPFDLLRQKLRAGQIDFIVGVLKTPADDLVDEPLFVDPYVIVGRRGHWLTKKQRVTLQDLYSCDWIVPNQGAPRHAAFTRLFDGGEPTTTIETHSLSTIRTVVAQSERLTLLTRSELSSEKVNGVFQPILFPSLLSAPVIGVTMRQGWQPEAERRDFLDMLRDHARALQANAGEAAPRLRQSVGRHLAAVA